MTASLEHLRTIARSGDESQLSEYLDFATECKIFCSKNDKREDITSFINNLLSSKETSKDGLVILNHFIEQCPREVLNLNILSWIQQAVKNLVNPDNGSLSSVAFEALGLLLDLSSNFPEARKQIALTIIPKVLDHFVRESKGRSEDIFILSCLEKTLKHYGKSCSFHKGPISKIIFSHLTSNSSYVHYAGRCYLALATCGGPGTDGENYVTSWHNEQKFLLNSLHNILDYLFENITEINDNHKVYKLEDSQPVLPKVSENSIVKRKQCWAKQFSGLAEFLKIHLLGPFSVRKRVLPEAILGLVWRGLSINSYTLSVGHQSIETSSLLTVISKINLSCLEILDALISSCSMNLISYSQLICKILSQAVKWTEIKNWPFGVTKPHCLLRVKIYECIGKWLTTTRACSGIEKHLDEIIPSFISDINHNPPTVSLKTPVGKGRKKLRELKAAQVGEASLEFLVNPLMNSLTCEAALKCVTHLMNSTSTLMKPNHHKELQTAIVHKLISIQNKKFPVPYTKPECRLALYEALLSLCQNSHHEFQPPISYAVGIFSAGIKDISVEVSKFCLFSLRSIEKILRPTCPSLDFPASEGSVDRINLSVVQDNCSVQEENLLNDSVSQKAMKRKRNSQQATSTPVNVSRTQSKFITPVVDSPVTGVQNLSDFEKGATFVESTIVETDFNEMSQSSVNGEENLSGYFNGDTNSKRLRFDKAEEEREENIMLSQKRTKLISQLGTIPDEMERVDEEPNTSLSQKYDSNINESFNSENSANNENKTEIPQTSAKISSNEVVISDDDENEMVNSFVDEVIEVS